MIRGEFNNRQFGWFTFEKHEMCSCSICKLVDNRKFKFGFLLPKCKMWNAWRWFFVKGIENNRYIRWAGFWKKRI